MKECLVKHSKQLDGICVDGAGSRLTANDCKVHGNAEVGVMAYDEGRVELKDCKIWDSRAKHGVYVKGVGTSATLDDCSVYDCGVSCLVAADGAAANASECEFSEARSRYGVAATGVLSMVVCKGCIVASNAKVMPISLPFPFPFTFNPAISGGFPIVASIRPASSRFRRSSRIHHRATCTVRQVGFFVEEGGRVEATDCEISGSQQYDGVSIRGTGSSGKLESCKVRFDFRQLRVVKLSLTATCHSGHLGLNPALQCKSCPRHWHRA